MKRVIKREILLYLDETIRIIQVKERKDFEELRHLSNKAIEAVALRKDLDMISVTVLIYSIYKINILVEGISFN